MAFPVTRDEVCAAVPSSTDLICNKLKSLFRLANLACEAFNYAFTANGEISDAFIALFARIGVPVGGLIDFPVGTYVPQSFLVCNGQAVNRTTYANLFSVIGTTHGAGDGTTTFNVPDYADTYRVGSSASVAPGKTAFGNVSNTVTLTSANNGPHTHRSVAPAQGDAAYNMIWGSSPDGSTNQKVYANDHGLFTGTGTAEQPIVTTLENSGSGTPFNIQPKSKAVLVLIKY